MKRILSIAIVLIIIVLAFVVFSERNHPESDADLLAGHSITAPEELSIKTSFADGIHSYSGMLTLPDPCYEIETEALVAESFPEQVRVNITTYRREEICAQVLADKTFEGTFQASEQAKVSYYLNGELVQ